MNYAESIAYLDSLGQFGIHLGMDRIKQLLLVLGHPENQIKTIHVAGTNGKGSVTSMVAQILLEAGLHVGKFTSPHLVAYNERIQDVYKRQDLDGTAGRCDERVRSGRLHLHPFPFERTGPEKRFLR